MQIQFYSQDGSLREDHALFRWIEGAAEGMEIIGQTLRPAAMVEGWVKNAGFENVHAVRDPLPIGRWPKNKKLVQEY